MKELRAILLAPSLSWRALVRARLERVPGVRVVAARARPGILAGIDVAFVPYSLERSDDWSVVEALRGQVRVLLVAVREADEPLLRPLCKTLGAKGVLPPLDSPRFASVASSLLGGLAPRFLGKTAPNQTSEDHARPAALPASKARSPFVSKRDAGPELIVIGASTGGVEAVREMLGTFPIDPPPTLLVQHIRGRFAKSMAEGLNARCRCEVRLAQDNDSLERGRVLVAPGDHHIFLTRAFGRLVVCTDQGPEVSHHRPSVDRLFQSVAEHATRRTVGVLLTGMGRDGAAGLLAMRRAGMSTIAQDEHTSTVYGMPKAAVALGAVQDSLPLGRIAEAALSMNQERT